MVGLQILEKLLASPYFGLLGLAVALIAIAATFAGRFSVGMARWILVLAWVLLMGWSYASAPNFSHQTEWKIGSMIVVTLICLGLWKWVKSPNRPIAAQQPAPLPAESPAVQQQTASGDARVKDSGNAKLKNVGNPTINVYTHPPAQKPEPPKPSSEPKSNISFKNVRPAWIWYSEHDGYFVEVDNSPSVRGVIARFKNESGARAASDAQYIRAELVFRDVNEQEMEQSVHAACWLRERANMVDFEVGEDHWVLLGLVDGEVKGQWLVPWKELKRTGEGAFYDLAGHKVPNMRSVEIRVIGGSNQWLTKPVLVDITVDDKGEPTVAVRPFIQH